eukprot:TRINITY_DN60490_c0_g1_i1.p1 TRINITY_DN60490_c0_g1~~TRINITY_DN60490_c0_g1_i1.p1  ORF type:complete len:363 (-),score=54.93 TRINITY_DN60490_c0_g1_i1:120-1208(-)
MPLQLLLLLFALWFVSGEDVCKTFYGCVSYQVVTKDGYILTLWNFPSFRTNKKGKQVRNKPSLVIHGIGVSAAFHYREAELLVERGYDTWLVNLRGTPLSMDHKKRNNTKAKFWNGVGWESSGLYDIPACATYILSLAKHKRLLLIGVSQGAASSLVALSTSAKLRKQVSTLVLFVPVVVLDSSAAPQFAFINEDVLKLLPAPAPGVDMDTVHRVDRYKVRCGTPPKKKCKASRWSYTTPSNLLLDLLPFPTKGISSHSLLHWVQQMDKQTFNWFDWGVEKNLKKYGSDQPPAFNLSLITQPTFLLYGEEDFLTPPPAREWVTTRLPNLVDTIVLPGEQHAINPFAGLAAFDGWQQKYPELI